jgi:hypothetical protein
MITIYELVDPRDNLPFYVGKTCNFSLRHGWYSAVADRIAEIESDGLHALKREIDHCADPNWRLVESAWICYYREVLAYSLTNRNGGGGGLTRHAPSTIVRLSQRALARPSISEATRAKVRAAANRRWGNAPDSIRAASPRKPRTTGLKLVKPPLIQSSSIKTAPVSLVRLVRPKIKIVTLGRMSPTLNRILTRVPSDDEVLALVYASARPENDGSLF